MVRAPTAANTEATKQKHNCWVRTPKPAKTETTKQKHHTIHDYNIYSSVAISVHCCLHWCSHRHLASVFAPCSHPAILHRCSHLACFHCSSLGSLQHHGDDRCGRASSKSIVDSIASRNQISLAFIRGHETDLGYVHG